MEMMYQRSKIQEESLEYEHRKHSGELPIIGVNTFINPKQSGQVVVVDLIRATEEEKEAQIEDVQRYQARRKEKSAAALEMLKSHAIRGENVFCLWKQPLQSRTNDGSAFSVGGQYRRNM